MTTKRDLLVTLCERARNEWNREKENLLTMIKTTDGGDLTRKISAIFALDRDVNEEFNARGRYIDQPNYAAARVARDDMVQFLKVAISKAFLKLLDRRQIYLTVKPEGQALVELEDAEIDAGIRVPREIPPAPKSAEETLRDQVIEDFKTLPTAKFKLKLNGNVDYRAMFESLSASNQLTLQATSLTNAGQVGG